MTSTILPTTKCDTVHFLVVFHKTTDELSGRAPSIAKLEVTLIFATYPVGFCPMLTILFI